MMFFVCCRFNRVTIVCSAFFNYSCFSDTVNCEPYNALDGKFCFFFLCRSFFFTMFAKEFQLLQYHYRHVAENRKQTKENNMNNKQKKNRKKKNVYVTFQIAIHFRREFMMEKCLLFETFFKRNYIVEASKNAKSYFIKSIFRVFFKVWNAI